MSAHRTIAITGGIGAGKSVVSRLLRVMGYSVYDCDLQAKIIIDTSHEIQLELAGNFGQEIFDAQGVLDRKSLAAIVFADEERLKCLNSIVHAAVIADLKSRIEEHRRTTDYGSEGRRTSQIYFFETALLYESGLDAIADEIWWVDAPRDMRIERVMRRSNLTAEQVEARMSKQNDQALSPAITILNDGITPLIPQVDIQLFSQPR